MTDRTAGSFDRALAEAARSLVGEPLPVDVLIAPRPVAARSWIRSAAPLAAAASIVIVTMAFAIGAQRGPGASSPAVFGTGAQIESELGDSGFACRSGAAASPGQPRMDAILCTTTTQTLVLSVVVSEDRDGRVGEFHISSNPPATSTAADERDRSDHIRRLIGLPFADPSAADAARAWLAGVLPLGAGGRARTTVAGTPIVVERVGNGAYGIVVGDLHAGPLPEPSD